MALGKGRVLLGGLLVFWAIGVPMSFGAPTVYF